MSAYRWDVLQVYRALSDYDNMGEIIKSGTLLQIAEYEGSSLRLKSEDDETYWMSARNLLNEDYFERVF